MYIQAVRIFEMVRFLKHYHGTFAFFVPEKRFRAWYVGEPGWFKKRGDCSELNDEVEFFPNYDLTQGAVTKSSKHMSPSPMNYFRKTKKFWHIHLIKCIITSISKHLHNLMFKIYYRSCVYIMYEDTMTYETWSNWKCIFCTIYIFRFYVKLFSSTRNRSSDYN